MDGGMRVINRLSKCAICTVRANHLLSGPEPLPSRPRVSNAVYSVHRHKANDNAWPCCQRHLNELIKTMPRREPETLTITRL